MAEDPFVFFREEMVGDADAKIDAMRNLNVVAACIGPLRTRTELIPYLETLQQDMNEVLVLLAKQMQSFLPLVGGSEFLTSLFPVLEGLFQAEENVVRENTTEALVHLVQSANIDVSAPLTQLLGRLVAAEWFTPRMSAPGVIAGCYTRVSDICKADMRTMLDTLSKDEVPVVKRSLLQALGQLSGQVEHEYLKNDLLQMIQTLSNDEHSAVRVTAVEQYPPLCEALKAAGAEQEIETTLFPLIRASFEDKSWKQRYALTQGIDKLARSLPQSVVSGEFLSLVNNVLQDPETEVRMVACKHLFTCFEHAGAEPFRTALLNTLTQLSTDIQYNVRQLIVQCAARILTTAGTSELEFYQPFIEEAFKDERAEVRLTIVEHMRDMAASVPDVVRSLTPSLKSASFDNAWRVRKAVVLIMPDLLKHLGQEYFVENFLSSYINCFQDAVAEVRAAAATTIPAVASSVGVAFFKEKVFPTLRALLQPSTLYLVRTNTLEAIRYMLEAVDPEESDAANSFQDELINLALSGTQDVVPNVRIMAVQVLGAVAARLNSEKRANLRSALQNLGAQDADKDVQYFARLSLDLCSQ